jgi:hypothetical protein
MDDFSYQGGYAASGEFGYISVLSSTSYENETVNIIDLNGDAISTSDEATLLIGILRPTMHFVKCEFWNASVTFTVESKDGIGSISKVESQLISHIKFGCSPYCNSYVRLLLEAAGYITGQIAYKYAGHVGYSDYTARAKDMFISSGFQWAEMMENFTSDNVSVLSTDGLTPAVEMRRNISFAEDVENFFLNSSMSLLNDPTLWSVFHANSVAMLPLIEPVSLYWQMSPPPSSQLYTHTSLQIS